jgi:hypothetical protein
MPSMATAALLAELAALDAKLSAGFSSYQLPTGRSASFDLAALRTRKTEILAEINRQNGVSRRNYAVPRRAT